MAQAETDVLALVPRVTPYHPNELGVGRQDTQPTIRTGLVGVFCMFCVVWWTIAAFLVMSPFLLLGLTEVVVDDLDRWRIRWIRRAGNE